MSAAEPVWGSVPKRGFLWLSLEHCQGIKASALISISPARCHEATNGSIVLKGCQRVTFQNYGDSEFGQLRKAFVAKYLRSFALA